MKNYLRYIYAILAVPLAVLLQFALMPLTGPGTPYVTLFPVTVFVALLGGLVPAILTGILGALTVDYLFIPPFYSALTNIEDISRMVIMVLTSVFVGYVGDMMRAARAKAEKQAITLRESQTDLNRAQAVGNIGSWRLDVRRNELTWSDENHHIFGIPKGTPMTYETFLGTVHPDDREYVDTKWKAGLAGEPYDIEHRIIVDGQVKWVCEKAYLEFDKDKEGELLGGFGTTQDITERKRAQEALRQTRDDLARSNKDLEQFAYVASHDLQEPLRAVAGFVELLKRSLQSSLDAKTAEYMNFSIDGVRRMQSLINGLLEYSRIGTLSKKAERTDSKEALDEAIAQLQAGIKESGAKITADDLPTVYFDEVQLAQLFQNLVGNAIKFRGEQTPRIDISATRGGNSWRFAVTDNGIGIEPQYTQRIFLIFQRLHTREKYPGTGIGLAICKKIVERHGGRIWVESKPGTGSTFYFTVSDKSR